MRGNFDYMGDPEVARIIRQQSLRVAREFDMDEFELEQEAHIYMATKADLQEAVGEPGLLAHRLRADLIDYVRGVLRRTSREVYGYEDSDEGFQPGRLFDDLATVGFRGGSGE